MEKDLSLELQAQVTAASEQDTPLRIIGGDSKAFYGGELIGEALSVAGHRGIVSYEPSELVVTVRSGTPLKDLERVLAAQGQMLPFEPPHYGDGATIGGTIACGFSGPRRPFAGAARDFVLGCKVLTGKGDIVSFGGQVMKNVAGYDVARLMTGALGTLGVLLEISLKVLPMPEQEVTLSMPLSTTEALDVMCARAVKPLPLTAASYDGEVVCLRLSGAPSALKAAQKKIAGEVLDYGEQYWREVREQEYYFFQSTLPLWRLSLAPATLPLPLQGQWFFDWGGAQRWLASDMMPADIRDAVAAEGGHATLFRNKHYYEGIAYADVFHPLSKPVNKIHQKLKTVFDPKNILNRDRFVIF
ncbi:MAG: glycolate oxidase subunit GlcE [Gammaproteobacteria bacterium]|nr:glycolate oxidase subunit GlcE [Gammaproteobacteria bacterium]